MPCEHKHESLGIYVINIPIGCEADAGAGMARAARRAVP